MAEKDGDEAIHHKEIPNTLKLLILALPCRGYDAGGAHDSCWSVRLDLFFSRTEFKMS